ncbi:hypothetical protein V4B17_06210 [Bartonella sp. B23]
MLKLILKGAVVSAIGFSTVACSVNDQRVAHYGVGGAAIGALAGTAIAGASPEAALTGAAFGALAGTVTGAAVNQKKQQQYHATQLCTYRDRRGYMYQAPCPQRVQAKRVCTYRDGRGVVHRVACPQYVR